MADEPENMTLVYLRRLDGKLDRVITDMDEMKIRLARLEEGQARHRRDQAGDAETVAHLQTQMDRMRTEVDRINRRLDIQEA